MRSFVEPTSANLAIHPRMLSQRNVETLSDSGYQWSPCRVSTTGRLRRAESGLKYTRACEYHIGSFGVTVTTGWPSGRRTRSGCRGLLEVRQRPRLEDVPFVVELRDGGPGVKVRR
jgi:hypothetical protein